MTYLVIRNFIILKESLLKVNASSKIHSLEKLRVQVRSVRSLQLKFKNPREKASCLPQVFENGGKERTWEELPEEFRHRYEKEVIEGVEKLLGTLGTLR